MPSRRFTNGTIVTETGSLCWGTVVIEDDRIVEIGESSTSTGIEVDLQGGYLVPGFIDLHVHGGDGADFMDGTEEAFETVCKAHARRGTTTLLATSTTARHDQQLAFLRVCRSLKEKWFGGAIVAGAHLYGPYFHLDARGCHPADGVRVPSRLERKELLDYHDTILTATVAPETPDAENFVRECRSKGIRCNVGHSHATFEQMQAALSWGVSHVDHLFCAMSDRARLRSTQTYPMRGGVLEATLYFDELTTEVIADGRHLAPELLRLAYKIKGANQLALVTDANRALGMPDGEYQFGPLDGGEKILRRDGVGLMPNGTALASGVEGMDTAIRVMLQATQAPLNEVIRMATLTPARIAGLDKDRGSVTVGKRADLVVLNKSFEIEQVWIGGTLVE